MPDANEKRVHVYIARRNGQFFLDIEAGQGDAPRNGVFSGPVDDFAAVIHAISAAGLRHFYPDEWRKTGQD